MISNSIDNSKDRNIACQDRPPCVEIRLSKRSLVLPWSLFLYAEGSDDEMRLTFATHEVVVQGAGLAAFLEDVSKHRVNLLREPLRADKFSSEAGPRITSISVRKMD